MGIIRNRIDILGITPEEDFPNKIENGQVVEYSEVENIFIPRHNSNIKNIYQIALEVKAIYKREVNIPIGKIVVIDGIKKIKIICTGKGHSQKSNIINLELPYNTFIELPEGKEVGSVDVKIIDAYFQQIDHRKIYSHIVYLVHTHYKKEDSFKNKDEIVEKQEKIVEDFEEVVIQEVDDEEVVEEDVTEEYVTEEVVVVENAIKEEAIKEEAIDEIGISREITEYKGKKKKRLVDVEAEFI